MAPARLLALLLLLVGAPAAAAESVGAWRFPRGWWGGGPAPPLFLGAWKRVGDQGAALPAPQGDVEAGETLLETWLRGHGEALGVAPPRAVRPQFVALPAFPWPQPRRGLQAGT